MSDLPKVFDSDITNVRTDEERGVRIIERAGKPPVTTKFTPERVDRVVEALEAKNPLTTAAEYAGVTRDCVYKWLDSGAECEERLQAGEDLTFLEQEYADFARRVRKARVEAEREELDKIIKASDNGTWQASAWWLERLHPGKYSRRQKVEHSGGTTREVKISLNIGTSSPERTDISDLEEELRDDNIIEGDYEIEDEDT